MKKAIYILAMITLAPMLAEAQGDNPQHISIKLIGEDQEISCTSEPVFIGVKVLNWQEGFGYAWSNGRTDSLIAVKPEKSTVYHLTVSNPSIGFSAVRSIAVNVVNQEVVAVGNAVNIDKHSCPGSTVNLSVDVSGGHGSYSYTWSNGATTASVEVAPENTTQYLVTVTDACGSLAGAAVDVVFEAHDPLVAPANETFYYACKDQKVNIRPDIDKVSGGVGHGYHFTFGTWNESDRPLEITPGNTEQLEYLVTDACGIQQATGVIDLVQETEALPDDMDLLTCKEKATKITDKQDQFYYWDGRVMHTEFETTFQEDTEVELIFIDACGETHNTLLNVKVQKVESDFDMHVNNIDRNVSLSPEKLETDLTYTWLVNGRVAATAPHAEFDLTEADENEITLLVTSPEGCEDRTTRHVFLQDGLDMPAAFSPNGDGLNDYFSIRFEDELQWFNIKIFDRWGQLIYTSRDQYFAWDGKINGEATPLTSYAYVLTAKTVSGKSIEKRGTISTLMTE